MAGCCAAIAAARSGVAVALIQDRPVLGGDWNWEYGMRKNTIDDAEHIRDHLLRAICGNFSNAKALTANARLELDWVLFIAGKRESRRLLGDHIVTQQDMVKAVYFEDAVGTTDWGVDLHFETATSYLSGYAKTNIANPCYFPFRSLYSRNVPNLMTAAITAPTTAMTAIPARARKPSYSCQPCPPQVPTRSS